MEKDLKQRFKKFFALSKLLTEEEFNQIEDKCDFSVDMPTLHHGLILRIKTNDVIPASIYKKLLEHPNHPTITVEIESKNLSTDYAELPVYLEEWIEKYHSKDFAFKDLLSSNNIKAENGVLTIKYLSRSELALINSVEKELLFFLQKAHFDITSIVLEIDKAKQNKILDAEDARKKAVEQAIKNAQLSAPDPLAQWKKFFKVTGRSTKIANITKELANTPDSFILTGEIIEWETKPSKNPLLQQYRFTIFDYEQGAIKCRYSAFTTPPKYLNFKSKDPKYQVKMPTIYLDSFKKGDWVNIECKIVADKYTAFEAQAEVIKMSKIDMPSWMTAKDNAENKRVELLMHSNLSAYDGLDSVEKIYKHTKSLGHKALGIVERFNVQSIPNIVNACKGTDIKPIYGCEFEVIEKEIPITVNTVNKSLGASTYIIFDIETTGLFPETEDLLEFGAIKYANGQIIDRIDFFAKPTKELTAMSINKCHITPDMVVDAISQKAALLKIKEWIKDDVLIAHNGIRFDLRFLNRLCEKYNVEPITNCLIDTLEISHAINKAFAKHSLGALTRKLKSDYNEAEAHRADKDCEYLLQVWQYFIKRLIDLGIETIDQINPTLQTASLRANRRGYIVDVYVKNQQGIKDLYKTLSLSLTERLFQKDDDEETHYLSNGSPKLYFEDLEPLRNNLIICPHPTDGDIWESALCDTTDNLIKKMSKYDYIFVAPFKNWEHHAAWEEISKLNIKKVTNKIIETAVKQNKKVCAVSDAYYLLPYEKQFHEVLVYTKQLGGKRHWLYRHDGNVFVPDLHYLTTQEMLDAFDFIKDEQLVKDIVINNTNEFANKVEVVNPLKQEQHAPKIAGSEQKLKDYVWAKANRLYGDKIDEKIKTRVQTELDGICNNGYAVIYWICHLLVKKSNEDGYLVGSRGSVGSSMVAFLSDISEVNPMPPHYLCPECKHFEWYPDNTVDGFDLPAKVCPVCGKPMIADGHDIPFESFVGIGIPKTPDIDLNFSGEYQSQAHNFIRSMFGSAHAFRAGTIATTAEKMAIGYVRSYFEQKGMDSIGNRALEIAYAQKLDGVKRTTGQHPGGIIVVPIEENICDFTPYNYPSNDKTKDWFTTHFEYHCMEKALLKFDILGHDEPTILKHLKDVTGVDPRSIPNHDDKVLQLFENSKSLGIVDESYNQDKIATIALPEFGTGLTRGIVKETSPKGVGDLIRISGLSHGTNVWKGNAQDIIKTGCAELKQVVACREDMYQFFGTCGLDFALGFQICEKVRKGKGVSKEYEKAMIEAKIPKWYIESCKKIQYLFPKAHATAYVLDALRTAWYKVYYPAQFYAVWFSIRSDVFDIETVIKGPQEVAAKFNQYNKIRNDKSSDEKLSNKQEDLIPIFEVCLEMFARGIKMKNIDINKSQATDFVAEGDEILPPFTSLDGLGKEAALSVVEARKVKPFTSIDDLSTRTKLSSTIIQKLKDLGVLDNLDTDDQMTLF